MFALSSLSHEGQVKTKQLDDPLTGQHEDGAYRQQDDAHQRDDALKENFKLLGVEFAAQVVDECMDLAQAKDPEGCHVLGGLHWLARENRHRSTVWRKIVHLLVSLTFKPGMVTNN